MELIEDRDRAGAHASGGNAHLSDVCVDLPGVDGPRGDAAGNDSEERLLGSATRSQAAVEVAAELLDLRTAGVVDPDRLQAQRDDNATPPWWWRWCSRRPAAASSSVGSAGLASLWARAAALTQRQTRSDQRETERCIEASVDSENVPGTFRVGPVNERVRWLG